MEENPVVQEALRRLPAEVLAERTFRHKRAMQLSLCHAELPKEQWTKPSEDVAYLSPFITMVEKEFAEKDKYDNLVVKQ
ncbi:hypothetical protein AMAG_05654 [Allomyces macrogynus ATCC 38327]|nr:hypothetical protein AMAG_05654 [Allomyces macrogynus ATCC 38327]|eukprot:KNE60241.1 hypothetical protein AMAG_05654 [Allomyces macrogynus ATCC 38327]